MPKLLKRKQQEDPYEDVAANVLDIVSHDLPGIPAKDKDLLMQHLVIYISGLTGEVHKHAYRLGRKHKDEES